MAFFGFEQGRMVVSILTTTLWWISACMQSLLAPYCPSLTLEPSNAPAHFLLKKKKKKKKSTLNEKIIIN
jgi:hypothetical protein